MIGDEDIELGARSQNGPTTASAAAAAVEPGSYVTQMRAAHNPVRFEPVTKRALAEDGRRDGGHQPPSSTRGMPTHYGIEGEPECCLCTKVGRFIIFLVVVTVIVLGVVYMYWDDIYKTPEGKDNGRIWGQRRKGKTFKQGQVGVTDRQTDRKSLLKTCFVALKTRIKKKKTKTRGRRRKARKKK